jgi:hypothetical protein
MDRLRERCECLRLLMEFLVSESLQDSYFYHMSPALTNGGSLSRWLEVLQGRRWLIFGEEDAGPSHLLSLAGKRREMQLAHIQFLDPACSPVQFAASKPKPDLIDCGKAGMMVLIGLLIHALTYLLSLLEESTCGLQICAREVHTYQYCVPPVEKQERCKRNGLFTQGDGLCGERVCASQLIALTQDLGPAESDPSYFWQARTARMSLQQESLLSQ